MVLLCDSLHQCFRCQNYFMSPCSSVVNPIPLLDTRRRCYQTKINSLGFETWQTAGKRVYVCVCVHPGLCRCASRPGFLAANGNQRPAEWRAQPPRVAVHAPVTQEPNHPAGPPCTAGKRPRQLQPGHSWSVSVNKRLIK